MTLWPSIALGYMKDPNTHKTAEITVCIPEESMLHFQISSTAALLLLHPLLIQTYLCKHGILPKIRAIVLYWKLAHQSAQ